MRRFLTMPVQGLPRPMVCHRSLKAAGGMSGWRIRLWGCPISSSCAYPDTSSNVRLQWVMIPFVSVDDTSIQCRGYSYSCWVMGRLVFMGGAMEHPGRGAVAGSGHLGNGQSEVVPLPKIDAHAAQHVPQRLRLDELGNHPDADVLAQVGQVAHQGMVDLGTQVVAHEGTVDLDEVEGQLAQVVEGVVAAAEVVQREQEAFFPQRLDEAPRLRHVADGVALQELEHQGAGRDRQLRAQVLGVSDHAPALHFLHRQVDEQLDRRSALVEP